MNSTIISLAAEGHSTRQIARKVGVSHTTVHKRLKEFNFKTKSLSHHSIPKDRWYTFLPQDPLSMALMTVVVLCTTFLVNRTYAFLTTLGLENIWAAMTSVAIELAVVSACLYPPSGNKIERLATLLFTRAFIVLALYWQHLTIETQSLQHVAKTLHSQMQITENNDQMTKQLLDALQAHSRAGAVGNVRYTQQLIEDRQKEIAPLIKGLKNTSAKVHNGMVLGSKYLSIIVIITNTLFAHLFLIRVKNLCAAKGGVQ